MLSETIGSSRSGWGSSIALRPSQPAAAQILHDRRGEAAAEGDELGKRRTFGEALDPEVGRVDAQNQRRLVADRRGVVGDPRAVGRAHFAQDRARLRHDVGNAEAAADLHQLTARDDHLASGRERGQRQQRRGGVVVDDERGFGAGEAGEQLGRRGCRGGRVRPATMSYSRLV